jgi:hypothetical protein
MSLWLMKVNAVEAVVRGENAVVCAMRTGAFQTSFDRFINIFRYGYKYIEKTENLVLESRSKF